MSNRAQCVLVKALGLSVLPVLFLLSRPDELVAATDLEPPELHLPLLDLPSNVQAPAAAFSMQQSLALSQSYYDLVHWGMESGLGLEPNARTTKGFFSRLGFFASDIFLLALLPGGEGWMHEEWHRAVMAHRGISSYNDIYRLDLGASVVNVSHETDEDLIRLKRDHNEDQVRLGAAGMEGEQALLQKIERESFFNRNRIYHGGTSLVINLSVISYMKTCASSEADTITDESNAKEESIPKRDFIGLDCVGWARDLNRPNEPYEARGVHPSGVGINRYTKFSDLNGREQKYLAQTSNYALINLLDPMIWGFPSFSGEWLTGEKRSRIMFSLRQTLTSFGTDRVLQNYFASSNVQFQSALHIFQNFSHTFPGLEFNLMDIDLTPDWSGELETMIWQQPKDFSFTSNQGEWGARVGFKFTYDRPNIAPFFSIAAKSKGWYMGEVQQDANLQSMAGVDIKFQ